MIPSVCYTYTQQGTKIIIIIYRNTGQNCGLYWHKSQLTYKKSKKDKDKYLKCVGTKTIFDKDKNMVCAGTNQNKQRTKI